MPAAIKFNQQEVDYIAGEYRGGKSIAALCGEFKCDARVIKRVLSKLAGVPIRPISNLYGNESAIVARYEAGESMESLAREYSICPKYVKRTVLGAGVTQRTMAEANRRIVLDESFFDEVDTEAKAYFLGFLYADGCNYEKVGRIVFALQLRDWPIIEQFRQYLGYEGEVKFKPDLNKAILTVGSKRLSESLAKLGCTARKSFTLTFPDWMPEDLLPHFLRGYIDGDGCYYLGNSKLTNRRHSGARISAIGSIPFIERMAQLLELRCDVRTKIAAHHSTDEVQYVFVQGTRQAVKVIEYLYRDATIYLQRKREKALSLTPADHTILTEQQVREIWQRIGEGAKSSELAKTFKVSLNTIQKIRKGEVHNEITGQVFDPATWISRRSGSGNVNAKLTTTDIAVVRQLAREGVTNANIATRFSVNTSTIQSITSGKTWKHVN